MPKMATKAVDNVFYKARIAAASWNDRLGSREGASEVTGIDRTRLANIELGTINPHPEEVLMLSDTYNAPELQKPSRLKERGECLLKRAGFLYEKLLDRGLIRDAIIKASRKKRRRRSVRRILNNIDHCLPPRSSGI